MAIKCVVFCVFISININLAAYVRPKIIKDSEDITLEVGEDYNITCQGSKPLTWRYPAVWEQEKQQWTSFENNPSDVPHNNDYAYRSVLVIRNMSYPFVGYYTCSYENVANGDNDQIYLFVNDPVHLSVEDTYRIHYAAQHQETTIPCRPTNRDVEVELISYGKDKSEIVGKCDPSTLEDHFQTVYCFDKKKGFWTNDTISEYKLENRGRNEVECNFRKNSSTQNKTLKVYFEASRAFLPIPHIEDLSNNHTDVGQVLNLACKLKEVSSGMSIMFQWETPRGTFRVGNGNTQVDKAKRKNGYLISNLHVLNTTMKDAGSYTCTVSDRQNHSSTSETYIMIHDTDSCFIEIREENNQRSITVKAGEEVQWILEVNGYPVPELIWIDNKGSVVKNDSMYETNQILNTAIFRIKNVSLENNGSYMPRGKVSRDLEALNCHNFEVILTVYDKPAICLDSRENCTREKNLFQKIYMLNEVVEIECKATGNPLPKINWLHKPCLEDGCKFVDEKPTREKNESKFVATSFLRVDTTHEGLITCIASNIIGQDVSNLTYYISDIKDGFYIYNFGDQAIVTTNNTTIDVIIAIGSTLTFTCAVSPNISDSIEIFFNNKSLSGHYIKNYYGIDLHKPLISLPEAKSDNGGVYSCRIRNLFTQLYEYKNVTITLKDPERPKIWTTNLDKEVVIDYPNMPYKLYCNYSGFPKPNVTWSKDNAPITPSPRIIFNENQKILEFVKTEVSDEGVYRCQVSNIAGHTFKEAALKFQDKQNNFRKYFFLICNKCFFQISIQ